MIRGGTVESSATRTDMSAASSKKRMRTTSSATSAEINTGILAAGAAKLRSWLQGSSRDNAQGEYYLTGVVARAVEDRLSVRTVPPEAVEEVLGVNDRVQLAALERFHQRRLAEALMREGASLADPARVDIRGRVRTGRDVFIDVNVVFEGDVVLGDRVSIGPGCIIKDTVIERDTEVRAHCIIEGANVGIACRVGPFARLRTDTQLSRGVHIGDFVELKNATLGEGSKANHLTYIGDSRIGRDVNVGAGVVTCNYDGANKHTTVIGDNAFIGSGVMLVAPVTVHAGATLGAGSTIGKDAPPDALTLTRAPQKNRQELAAPAEGLIGDRAGSGHIRPDLGRAGDGPVRLKPVTAREAWMRASASSSAHDDQELARLRSVGSGALHPRTPQGCERPC